MDIESAKLADYRRMTQAIAFLEEDAAGHPGLDQVAAAIGLSPVRCQRLFRRYSGVSPRRFLQYLAVNHARTLLRETPSVLEASLETDLSCCSRLHDRLISLEAVAPGEYHGGVKPLTLEYGVAATRFGSVFLAATSRGICCLRFVEDETVATLVTELQTQWQSARVLPNPDRVQTMVAEIFRQQSGAPLTLLVQGSSFQIRVWQALLAIPQGGVVSYGQLAEVVGSPGAARAVGGAVGANPVAYLIPCHRVIRADGSPGGYRWGRARKQLLLASEADQ